jgi:four helix bundle protein
MRAGPSGLVVLAARQIDGVAFFSTSHVTAKTKQEKTMPASSYRDLVVWRTGMKLAKEVCRLTVALPRQETYGLSSQMRRAAVSVPANIAEGHARGTPKELLQFLRIARGSLAELETMLTLAQELDYLPKTSLPNILSICDEVGRMITGLRRSIQRRTRQGG